MKNFSKGKMKKFLNFIVIILLLAGTSWPNGFILPAHAATVGIPSYLSYQGRLKNASGSALSGTYDFSFKLYDASTSGNLLWTENKTLTVTSGYFTTSLGDSTAFGSSVDFTKNLWLDISVAATGVTPLESMTSRVAVNSAAFALAARSIENAASDPATAFGGRMYYNTASGNTYVYDAINAAWSNVYRSGGTDVPVVDGGTGASNASQARTNLGLAINTDVQAYDADLTTYAGITPSANIQSLLGSANYTVARSNLGLAINSDVQAYDADLTTYAGITPSANIQTLLGSADFSTARTNLGVAIGSNVQAYNAGLADVAGLSTTDSNFVVGNGTNWVAESGATVRTSLGLAISTDVQAYDADLTTYAGITPSANIQTLLGSADFSTARTNLGVAIGSNVQAYNAGLADVAGLATTDSNFIVGNGTNWVAETGATVRTSLGLAIGSNVQAYDADLTTYAGITPSTNIQTLLGSADFSTARTNLGVAIGSNVQAYNAGLADVAGLATTDSNFIVGNGTNWVAETGATVRTSLGLAINTDVQAYDADLTTYAGITPSANIQTLLGSADFSTARTNLGVAIGSNVQAYNAGLADVAGLLTTDSNFIVGNGTNWVAETGATVRTSLGLGSMATQNSDNATITAGSVSVSAISGILGLNNGGTGGSNATTAQTGLGLLIGTNVQAYDADLTTYAGITPSANIQTLLGSADFSTARTNLGLGTIATQNSDNVTITGGSISGITDLAVADGGTGLSSTTINQILYSSSNNTIAGLASANSGVLVTGATGIPSVATDIPTAVTIGSGYIYRVGGTDVAVADGGTGLSSTTINQILYSSSNNTIAGLASANSGVLVTSATGVPSISSTLPTLTGGVVIAPTTTGTLTDYQLETEWTTGTLINADFGTATTLTSDVVGVNLDLQTNVTGATDQDVTGVYVKTPALTQSASNTTLYYGEKIGGGDITSSNGTVFWSGNYYLIPNIDLEPGANLLQVSGASIGFGTITTAGTMNGLTVGYNPAGPSNGVDAGTLTGIMINQIISKNGTETAMIIGSGWDTGISIGMLSDDALAIDVTNGAVHVADRIGMGTWTADGDVAVYYDTNSSSTNYLGTTISDVRLKKNIALLEDNALEIISNVNTYKYNTLDETDGAKKRLGVMAQEIIPYMPELTFEIHQENDNATYYGVHYDKLPVLLLKAIKEQQKQIQSLSVGSSLQGSLTGNISLDNLKVAEHATFGGDTVGRARILPGATEARVNFAKQYEYQPIVVLTPRGENVLNNDFKYTVINESTSGFTIKIGLAVSEPLEFNWNAFGSDQGKIFVSDGTAENIEIAIGQPAEISAPSSSESPSSSPAQSAEDNNTSVSAADNSTIIISSSDNSSAANSEPIAEPAPAQNIEPAPTIEPAAGPSAAAAPAVEPEPAPSAETASSAESPIEPAAESSADNGIVPAE